MKHRNTIILSVVLFLLACWLIKDCYNLSRSGCSGLLTVFYVFLVYIPILLFAFTLFFRAVYRYLWKGREAVELMPIGIIAMCLASAFAIDNVKQKQDKDLWLTAASRYRGARETHVLFRNNGTYTVTDKGPCYGCTWSSSYSRRGDTVIIEVAENDLILSHYIMHDSVLKPIANLQDSLMWLYVVK